MHQNRERLLVFVELQTNKAKNTILSMTKKRVSEFELSLFYGDVRGVTKNIVRLRFFFVYKQGSNPPPDKEQFD